ncbi:cbb3-type cytochrome c oxidase subunit I [Ramlibacter sp. USB13]|uniref:Cbb3-type cytochrome c oxidase subunit I n=1 Tax=Ramlibacter cellulosilyticus TaxID=2764187 RepID=A0A923MVX2_9BURK|nr:cbb3-type cytochrome c oxidase subunit I [Ramlibacter cellulosilyticus]MBC5785639.1 cbb3-type cytochrome c oxidase subunit I [Ramlibacter cellulosilyticus]
MSTWPAVLPAPHARPAPAPARSATDYACTVPTDERVALARGWLHLGLAALVASGLFSVLLVVSRTPGINSWLPAAGFFHVALVVHVDLSVLVWFAALAGMLWSLHTPARGLRWGQAALALCALGTAAMAIAPFTGAGTPVMANYIPVLAGPLFLGGLLVFAAGVALLVLRTLAQAPRLGFAFDGRGALRFGLNVAAVATAVALLAFAWSWVEVPTSLEGKAYYEILFWGGGHALQFTWTLLMLVAWLWLAGACGAKVPLSPRVALLMFALALLAVFVTPYAYVAYPVASVEHRALLTWAMRLGGGVAILPVALAAVVGMASAPPLKPQARPWRAALLSSVLLFGAGGLIGVAITGSNVRIPAHYHGCIVGVTLALMGMAYQLLPALGYAAPAGRLATAQPWVYAAGQLMHIVGLVWSGGYGVQRKVAGAGQVLRTPGEIAGMGLMGLGGAIAIAGGLLFLVVVLRAMRRPAVR